MELLDAYVPVALFVLVALTFPLLTFFLTPLFPPTHPTLPPRPPAPPPPPFLPPPPLPAHAPPPAQGPHVRVRGDAGGRGGDPVPLPVLHVRPDLRRVRRRGRVPRPVGVHGVRRLPRPRGHARDQDRPVRADAPGVHPDPLCRDPVRAEEGIHHPHLSAAAGHDRWWTRWGPKKTWRSEERRVGKE